MARSRPSGWRIEWASTAAVELGMQFGEGHQDEIGEDGFFGFEVEVDGALGDFGALGDLVHRRPPETLLGKDRARRQEDVVSSPGSILLPALLRCHRHPFHSPTANNIVTSANPSRNHSGPTRKSM